VLLIDHYKGWGEISVAKNTRSSHKHPPATIIFELKHCRHIISYKLPEAFVAGAKNILRTTQHLYGYILTLILCNMPWVNEDSVKTAEGSMRH